MSTVFLIFFNFIYFFNFWNCFDYLDIERQPLQELSLKHLCLHRFSKIESLNQLNL